LKPKVISFSILKKKEGNYNVLKHEDGGHDDVFRLSLYHDNECIETVKIDVKDNQIRVLPSFEDTIVEKSETEYAIEFKWKMFTKPKPILQYSSNNVRKN